ncbi:MAG: hypothetical protein KDD02_26630, partial [Phaeodactylibacter sp.]|nr:hypothetical protein [Phaeodactylibacter sp.]
IDAALRTCLKFVFGNEKDSFVGEIRLFLKFLPGRYGQKKERSITEKGAFSTRSMKFKQVLSYFLMNCPRYGYCQKANEAISLETACGGHGHLFGANRP